MGYDLLAAKVRPEAEMYRAMIHQIIDVGERLISEPLAFLHMVATKYERYIRHNEPNGELIGCFVEVLRLEINVSSQQIFAWEVGRDPDQLTELKISTEHSPAPATYISRDQSNGVWLFSDQMVADLHERLIPVMLNAIRPSNPINHLPLRRLSRVERIILLQQALLATEKVAVWLNELSKVFDLRLGSLDDLVRLRDCELPLAETWMINAIKQNPKWITPEEDRLA